MANSSPHLSCTIVFPCETMEEQKLLMRQLKPFMCDGRDDRLEQAATFRADGEGEFHVIIHTRNIAGMVGDLQDEGFL
jgi:hypothetical protein